MNRFLENVLIYFIPLQPAHPLLSSSSRALQYSEVFYLVSSSSCSSYFLLPLMGAAAGYSQVRAAAVVRIHPEVEEELENLEVAEELGFRVAVEEVVGSQHKVQVL